MKKIEKIVIGNREFDVANHTYVMGILNVTPDSFSDGGKYNHLDEALFRVEQMVQEGADIIDVGGESTRPGYVMIPDEEEIERTVPVIEAIKSRFDIPVSIDTYKSEVAKANVKAGADLVNDIWGLKYDEKMAPFIAKEKIPCCLMHNRKVADYKNFMAEMKEDLKETIKIAKDAGIKKKRIILDPGVGFGKTYDNNLEAIRYLNELCEMGFPVLLATSRKSVIGLSLDLPVEERVEGTLATTVMGVMNGAAFVRVHDIKENKRAIMMTEAVLGRKDS
ncbi:MAG: dihydropteroate synthase [Lachnospiraceae bacterium]